MYVQASVRTIQISTVLLATSLAYKLIAACLRRRFRARYTAIYDVDGLNPHSAQQEAKRGTVVIAGGSIAGLFTARICADYFTDVIVVDPEVFRTTEKQSPTGDASNASARRSRVFQYPSLHAYQAFILLTLRKLFPGFDQHLAAVGGYVASDSMFHMSGRRLPLPSSSRMKNQLMAVNRDVFEPLLRKLVLSSRPNITCIDGSVTSVHPTTDTWERLASASISFTDSGETKVYTVALVVDCTGRAAHGYRWFKGTSLDSNVKEGDVATDYLAYSDLPISYDHKIGSWTWEFVVPTNFLETVDCHVDRTYATLYISFPDHRQDGKAVIFALYENTRLMIAFGGYDIHESVTSVADIRAFLLGMALYEPMPQWIHNVMDALEENDYPSTSWTARVPPSKYIRYHRAAKLPCNFIALGDSALNLNPVLGQGCTKACVEAVTLNAMLKSMRNVDRSDEVVIPLGFSRQFFRIQCYRTGRLWDSNRATDYGFETTVPAKGEDHSFGESQRTFIAGTVLPTIIVDEILAAKFWNIHEFLEAPTELMFPSALFRFGWNAMKVKLFLADY